MDNKQKDQQSPGKHPWQKVDWAKLWLILSHWYQNARKVVQAIFSKARTLVKH